MKDIITERQERREDTTEIQMRIHDENATTFMLIR
jgi:hypothetical protein